MTVTITDNDINSIAYDAATGLLGYTTEGGFFRLVDTDTGERVETYNLGSALGGFAFASDGTAFIANVENAAYWTDQTLDAVVHRLDRNEPAVENLSFALDYGNSSATDIAIAANGLALVTVTSQWTPLYVLDTASGTFAQLQGDGYQSFYSPRVTLSDAGRYALVQEVGSSGGSVHLWDSTTNAIVAQTDNFAIRDAGFPDTGYGDEDGAVSDAAGLIVLGDLLVFDLDLNPVVALGAVAGRPTEDYYSYHGWDAYAFSADGTALYAIDGERDLLIEIDTATFDLADAWQFPVPEDEDSYEGVVSDLLLIGTERFVVQTGDALLIDDLSALSAPRADGTADADNLVGSRADDILTGYAGDDALLGADGNDLLNGGRGADVLMGGRGADTLSGGVGDDTLDGGAGADVYRFYADDAGRDDIIGFGADDVIDLRGIRSILSVDDLAILRVGDDLTVTIDDTLSVRLVGPTVSAANIAFDFFEPMIGTAMADTMIGDDADDYIDGGSGNDMLWGMGGSDEILGGAGNDVIYGGAGDDVIYGGG